MLEKIKTALDGTGIPFAHFAWSKAPNGTYGVYAEDSAGGSIWGDGKMQEQAIEGTIDVFTRDDTGTPLETVQEALNTGDISWYLNSIQYEEDTGYIHYEWVFQVVI